MRGLHRRRPGHVQARLGIADVLERLSEAASVFDAARLHEVLITWEPPARSCRWPSKPHWPLIAVDGSPAAVRDGLGLWQDDQHRAAKMHVAFAVLLRGPSTSRSRPGTGGAGRVVRLVQPGGFYVVDRGM